ncbi:MAG: GNAT family N-acetyltransferase [Anaerolineae bacterium]
MGLDLVVERRLRADSDRALLVREANATPFIAMLTVANLLRLERTDSIFYYYHDAAIVGFGAWQNVNAQWAEIGPFFNRDAYRGQGLGRRFFRDVIRHLEDGEKSLYAVTKNDAVKHMLEGYGFEPTSVRQLPIPLVVHLATRLDLRRVYYGLRKMSSKQPTIHLLKPFPYQRGRIE